MSLGLSYIYSNSPCLLQQFLINGGNPNNTSGDNDRDDSGDKDNMLPYYGDNNDDETLLDIAINMNMQDCAFVLMKNGGKWNQTNKELSRCQWIFDYQKKLANCRSAQLAVKRAMSLKKKYHLKDLVNIISNMVWETNTSSAWIIDNRKIKK